MITSLGSIGRPPGRRTGRPTPAPEAVPARRFAAALDGRPGLQAVADWLSGYLHNHPVRSLGTAGSQVILGIRAIQYLAVDLCTGRFPVGAYLEQTAFVAGTAFLPTVFVTIPVGVTLSIQFSLLAGQVGASSMAGAATGLVVIRQAAPLVAAMLLAVAVGSAVCADLGSRTMREEIQAMEVMGVMPIRRLVVPRLAALITVGVLLTGITFFVGYLAGYVFNVFLQNGTAGSFIATFSSFSDTGDMWLALVKAVVFGLIVAVVSCQKGLDTSGGPAGVANSVNAAVVESILLLMFVNVVMSQLYVIVFPRQAL